MEPVDPVRDAGPLPPASQLCVLVCRVDPAQPEAFQPLHRIDLPAVPVESLEPGQGLEALEAQVSATGHAVMRTLLEVGWEALDQALVADYQRLSPPLPRAGRL